MIFKMALRNLARNKRRTLITLSSIAFGMMLSIIFTGIGDSSYRKMIDGAARLGVGHVSVTGRGFLDMPSLENTVRQADSVADTAREAPGVEAATVRIMGQAMIATARDSVGGTFMAVDPEMETGDTSYLFQFLKEGRLFHRGETQAVIIGSNMARRLNVKLGSKVVYSTTDRHGEISSGLARVRGIFQSGVLELDSYFALLPIDAVRKTLDYRPGEATHVCVFLRDYRDAPSVIAAIQATDDTGDADVLSWRKTSPEMAGLISMDMSMNYLFQVIIFLLVAAGILNTILMSVLERKREFGIMLAIGMNHWKLFQLIMAETVWLGILGLAFGLIVTAPVYQYIHTHGLDFSRMVSETADVGGVIFDPIVYAKLRLSSLLIILSGAFLITVLSGLYPAWKAGRVVPVEALKTI